MGKLLVLMITAFVDMVGFAMVLPLVPFYAARMGATGFIVGLLISSFSIAQLVSAPSWGRVSDRFGRRPAVIIGLLISNVAYVVFGLRESTGMRQTAEHPTPVVSLGAEGSALRRVITHASEPAPRLIWIYTIAIGAFYGTAPLLSLLFADRLGVTEGNVGFFVMYFGGMGVIIRAAVLGVAVKKLGEARLARLGLVLLAAWLGVIAVADSYLPPFVAIALMPA